MQKQIKLSTKFTKNGKERLIDLKLIQSSELQNHIKIKYNLEELSNFYDFLIGKSDLAIGWYAGNRYEGAIIETSPSIKKNVANFNLYVGDCI